MRLYMYSKTHASTHFIYIHLKAGGQAEEGRRKLVRTYGTYGLTDSD